MALEIATGSIDYMKSEVLYQIRILLHALSKLLQASLTTIPKLVKMGFTL